MSSLVILLVSPFWAFLLYSQFVCTLFLFHSCLLALPLQLPLSSLEVICLKPLGRPGGLSQCEVHSRCSLNPQLLINWRISIFFERTDWELACCDELQIMAQTFPIRICVCFPSPWIWAGLVRCFWPVECGGRHTLQVPGLEALQILILGWKYFWRRRWQG